MKEQKESDLVEKAFDNSLVDKGDASDHAE
jgi:hypothetical protein